MFLPLQTRVLQTFIIFLLSLCVEERTIFSYRVKLFKHGDYIGEGAKVSARPPITIYQVYVYSAPHNIFLAVFCCNLQCQYPLGRVMSSPLPGLPGFLLGRNERCRISVHRPQCNGQGTSKKLFARFVALTSIGRRNWMIPTGKSQPRRFLSMSHVVGVAVVALWLASN
jgi:hypothetical protein